MGQIGHFPAQKTNFLKKNRLVKLRNEPGKPWSDVGKPWNDVGKPWSVLAKPGSGPQKTWNELGKPRNPPHPPPRHPQPPSGGSQTREERPPTAELTQPSKSNCRWGRSRLGAPGTAFGASLPRCLCRLLRKYPNTAETRQTTPEIAVEHRSTPKAATNQTGTFPSAERKTVPATKKTMERNEVT